MPLDGNRDSLATLGYRWIVGDIRGPALLTQSSLTSSLSNHLVFLTQDRDTDRYPGQRADRVPEGGLTSNPPALGWKT